MKTIFTFLFFVALTISTLSAQISVLFVDDSDDTFGNAELFHSSIVTVGYEATYYNAVDSAVGPSDLYMNDFDLVVWHTSSDGSELLLWNGLDEDNASLKSYLNGGGNLWLVGNDFFFDRYAGEATSFSEGDFAYDYLGIASYDLQTYADDGGLGVPSMFPDSTTEIEGLNELTWQFSTLWYADGITLTDGANPVYRMGDEEYVLANTVSGGLLDNGTSRVLTYAFDISLVNNIDILTESVSAVMSYFNENIVASNNIFEFNSNAKLYPNPTSNKLNLEVTLINTSDISISLLNSQGQAIAELMPLQRIEAGEKVIRLDLNNSIPDGYYFLKVNMDDKIITKSIVLKR